MVPAAWNGAGDLVALHSKAGTDKLLFGSSLKIHGGFGHASSCFNPGQRNELLSSLLLGCHVLLSICLLFFFFFASIQPHMPNWAVMYAVGT